MKQGSDYYFYQNDHLGTPQKLTAINGAVVWAVKYTSFGEATAEIETVENNLRFPGQYYDQETDLHFNYFRYYDPDIGRYLRTDPIGLVGGINLFVYAENNSSKLIDSKGLFVDAGVISVPSAIIVGGSALVLYAALPPELKEQIVEDLTNLIPLIDPRPAIKDFAGFLHERFRPKKPEPYDVERAKRNLKRRPLPKLIKCEDKRKPPTPKSCIEGCIDAFIRERIDPIAFWVCVWGCHTGSTK